MRLGGKKEKWLRRCEGFLWLPLSIDGETRWLEHAVWYEQYFSFGRDGMTDFYAWQGISWDELPFFCERDWKEMYGSQAS